MCRAYDEASDHVRQVAITLMACELTQSMPWGRDPNSPRVRERAHRAFVAPIEGTNDRERADEAMRTAREVVCSLEKAGWRAP